MSAGFDKNAEVIGASFNMGFGFVEVGTVTPKPQEGNPQPRIFRDVANDAVINRMGFPNGGMEVFKANLEAFLSRKKRPSGVVGLNIGMNKTQAEPAKDYATLIRMLGPMADYITINISSPNTPGLRDLQKREPLLELIAAVKNAREKACGAHPPALLVKLAPDLDEAQQAEMAQTLMDGGVDGVILGNTTLDRPESLPEGFRGEAGGLSGQPLTDKSTEVIANFYKLTDGKLPIIGVGGISNGAQAYDKIKAGASLVQLYTALVFKGPALVGAINAELLALLKADGYNSIVEAVGADHKSNGKGQHAA
jgi:dihydroorotate dehydrogenase